MNEYIAAAVDELYELGVREVVISPGSRSTPLAMLFCEHSFKVYVNIDERSAAFFALGIAKEFKRPVVLVCTSGSAVAHYFPAVIEAKHSRVPLIILTADRPSELQRVGAPQTIDQNKLYGDFLKYYEELAIPEEKLLYTYPRMVMRKAYLYCQGIPKGPVQINIPLREPLVPELKEKYFQAGRDKKAFQFLSGKYEVEFDYSCFYGKKVIIAAGGDASSNYGEEIISLGEKLKAPVLADPLSNIRSYKNKVIVDSYDAFLKDKAVRKMLQPDYILLFGQPPVSKRLQQFIKENESSECLQIDTALEYRNPSLTTTKYIQADAKKFAMQINYTSSDEEYLGAWQKLQRDMREKLERAREEEILFEGKIVQLTQDIMPENSRLVAANSMSIRDLDYFWKAENKAVKLLCNRGVNGIDGTISTALGVSTAGYPTVLLTGDLAFFHDMNGLLLGKTHGLNLVIILINNDGGGIFQYLPQKGSKHFDYLFKTPHGMDFQGVQALYGVGYHKVTDYENYKSSLEKALSSKGISIIEVDTEMDISYELHEKYTRL